MAQFQQTNIKTITNTNTEQRHVATRSQFIYEQTNPNAAPLVSAFIATTTIILEFMLAFSKQCTIQTVEALINPLCCDTRICCFLSFPTKLTLHLPTST